MIEERALQILSLDGYIDAWWVYIQSGYTRKEAFDMLENEYMNYFGEYRYTCYQNFYRSVWRRMKRHNENKTARL